MPERTLPTRPFHVFALPYRRLEPVPGLDWGPAWSGEWRGAALVWRMSGPMEGEEVEFAQGRPPGVSLVTILPPADRIGRPERVLRMVELCRPRSVLPHHELPDALDLRTLLARPPEDLGSEITDYLSWRGIDVDLETRRLIRKTVDLSADLRTVQGLARSLYLSRRALGRRFMSRGLPVPSHWLQMSRLLRAVIRLQNSEDSLLVTASSLGYPDGFALSNQMKRLMDLRPSDARRFLGWEWLLESWLRVEARDGGMAPELARVFTPRRPATELRAVDPIHRGRREAPPRPERKSQTA